MVERSKLTGSFPRYLTYYLIFVTVSRDTCEYGLGCVLAV